MENFKLYKHVYEDAEMACSSMEDLIISLKDKDNKIKGCLELLNVDKKSFKDRILADIIQN